MPETPTTFARRHKLLLATLATMSLSLGAASVVSAAQSPPTTNHSTTVASEDVSGVDCVDGLDAATGSQCDGGPSANAANDPTETNQIEVAPPESSDAAHELDGVDCENGIDKSTGAECDGGPSANADNGPTEASGDQETEAANQ